MKRNDGVQLSILISLLLLQKCNHSITPFKKKQQKQNKKEKNIYLFKISTRSRKRKQLFHFLARKGIFLLIQRHNFCYAFSNIKFSCLNRNFMKGVMHKATVIHIEVHPNYFLKQWKIKWINKLAVHYQPYHVQQGSSSSVPHIPFSQTRTQQKT